MNPAPSRPDLDRLGGQALLEVLEAWLGLPATQVNPVNGAATEASGARLIAKMPLTSDRFSGTVHVRIPRAFAQQAAAGLIGKPPHPPMGDTEVEDFAGELCNLLAGRVAARLRLAGYPCALGTPEVGHETACPPETAAEPGADRSRSDWSCQGHPLTLEMRFRYRLT